MQTRALAFGYGRQLSGHWALDSTITYQLPSKLRSDNPALPLGGSFEERYAVCAAMFTLSRRW